MIGCQHYGRSCPSASGCNRHARQRCCHACGQSCNSDIPIVFGTGQDPVKLGLVASLARPGGNATGINFFSEVTAKRLRLLMTWYLKAVRVAVLVNPNNASPAEAALREAQEAAPTIGLQIQILNATTISEINSLC